MLMILLFAFALGIFPARATPDIAPGEPGYYLSLAYHMVLPLATIVLIGFGSWSYLVRNFMIGAMQEEHIFAKRAIGISKRKIVYSHDLLTRGSKYPYSKSAMNTLTRKNTVRTYVAPIITGKSSTVMASK